MTTDIDELVAEQAPAPAAAPDPPGEPPVSRGHRLLGGLEVAGALLPAALVALFVWQKGGYFPRTSGLVACALAVVLALRVTVGRRPFASLGAPAALVAGALGAYAVWTLVSAAWSDAPGRALLEFNRTLLYGLAFLLCATLPWSRERLALALRALALVIVVACAVGWATRVAPDVFSVALGEASDRLSYPLTYWNAQGMLAALGVILCAHLACARREPAAAAALAAAAMPLVATTMFFTFSRGAMLAAIVGLGVYVVVHRSRALLAGLAVTLGPTALALVFAYRAGELASDTPGSARGIEQGHEAALGIAACMLIALLLRLATRHWLDPALERITLPPRARRPARALATVGTLVVLVTVALSLGVPAFAERQYDRFLQGSGGVTVSDQRDRLLNPTNNGRIDHWRVALDTWERHPLRGTGAGTYQFEWNQHRRIGLNVRDAHSLYLETLSDMGLVGLLTLAVALGTIATAGAGRKWRRGIRRPGDRALIAVFPALFATWAVQAGLDWIWETPAVTVWLFALGGLALASRVPASGPAGPGNTVRVAVGLGCLVLAVMPFQVARSDGALTDAIRAFDPASRDCPAAIDASLRSLASVGARPEPWEIIAYCDVGAGAFGLAVQAARNAADREPRNWTYAYGQALVQAVAGQDPRPAARRALRLNPRNILAREAVETFAEEPPRRWPAVARTLQLPAD